MKKKTLKRIGLVLFIGIIIAGSVGAYMWFKPHRDVQSTNAFATLTAKQLTDEFTADVAKANAKYLASDGNSKVLIIEGRVSSIKENQNGDKVIVLKDEEDKVGVSAGFTKKTNANAASVKVGDIIKIKGAITAGNRYDADLDLYEHAVLMQSDIVK